MDYKRYSYAVRLFHTLFIQACSAHGQSPIQLNSLMRFDSKSVSTCQPEQITFVVHVLCVCVCGLELMCACFSAPVCLLVCMCWTTIRLITWLIKPSS